MQTLRPSWFHCHPWNGHCNDLAHDMAAVAEVCTEVFAVGVHDRQPPDCARQATISRSKYFIRCTSPTLISSDHATWNQPVGFIDNGGLAMDKS